MATFPTTHWSQVTNVRQASPEARRRLVESFLLQYASPLRIHIAARFPRIDQADRDDLLQDFITSHFLQKSILDRADRERGRLRSLLRVSLNNHVKTWLAKRRRDVLYQAASLDGEYGDTPPDADASFDLAWARYVLTEAVIRFKDDCMRGEKHLLWDVFDLRLLRPALVGTPTVPYQDLADRYHASPHQLENLLVTAKRQFGRIVRDIVGVYTSSVEETEEEIRELRNITSGIMPGLAIETGSHE